MVEMVTFMLYEFYLTKNKLQIEQNVKSKTLKLKKREDCGEIRIGKCLINAIHKA